MNGNSICATALLTGSAMLSTAGPASAAKFDGSWNMVAETTQGHCGVIDIGVVITQGRVRSTSGSFAFHAIRLGGQVSSSGQARLTVVTGPRTARGTGRFKSMSGSGTWSGTGPSGLCSGVWTANRY
jgi:hypothetical protein